MEDEDITDMVIDSRDVEELTAINKKCKELGVVK